MNEKSALSRAYLGIGSNQGDRLGHLKSCVRRLKAHGKITVVAVSSVYRSEPFGVRDQPEFYNACVGLDTSMEPEELLSFAMELEVREKRVRTRKWGPRTLDVDLLLFGDKVIESSELTIPHPEMFDRLFVLEPLREIAPHLVFPDGRSIEEVILAVCGGQFVEKVAGLCPLDSDQGC